MVRDRVAGAASRSCSTLLERLSKPDDDMVDLGHGQSVSQRRVMGARCPAAPTRAAQAQGRPTARPRPRRPHRHHLRAEDRRPLGDAATGDGLRLRCHVLAAPARLAGDRRVGAAPSCPAGPLGRGQPDRLEPGLARLGQHFGQKGGTASGRTRRIAANRARSAMLWATESDFRSPVS
jgi:hypothetical protein